MANAKKVRDEEKQAGDEPAREDLPEEAAPATALTPEERRALDEMFLRLYNQLKALAARVRWNGDNPTLNPTALVHEAYLKMMNSRDLAAKSDAEIIGILGKAMRQILIDAARRKRARKRGGTAVPDANQSWEREGLPQQEALSTEQILTLEAAQSDLERANPRQSQVIVCRFYLGMTTDETAIALRLSKSTVEREDREARAFLGGRIRPGTK